MADNEEGTDEAVASPVVVVDMGEHTRERVKKLRKGKGKLFRHVGDTVADLMEEGVLDGDAQTVIVVVEREPEFPWTR